MGIPIDSRATAVDVKSAAIMRHDGRYAASQGVINMKRHVIALLALHTCLFCRIVNLKVSTTECDYLKSQEESWT
jgi:hypothetical protein